jgi:cyanuric acid amidohydrolase
MALVQKIDVWRIPCSGPSDLSGAQALIEQGLLDPASIVAVMGKTEGNGCVNDFTRDFATTSWCYLLAQLLKQTPKDIESRVAFVMSGGTEGALSPHFTVFTRLWVKPQAALVEKRLVVGIAQTREFLPEEIGRAAQISETAEAVKAAMKDAGIDETDDVHFVQVKCPLLSSAKVSDALLRGVEPVTHETYESMGYSRGASALGVALALNEVKKNQLSDSVVLSDWSLFSSRASASAGIELDHNVVIVLGQSTNSTSDYLIGSTVMTDAIDSRCVRSLLRDDLNINPDGDIAAISDRLVNIFAKAEASPNGVIRGHRHTMLNDSDINSTRHARAAVGAVLASIAGHGALYVSGGAEHQGPPGGGPVAAIVRA